MQAELVQTQYQRNIATRVDRDSYASHREHVMRLIEATASDLAVPGGPDRGGIALLGAGNCLDVDLPRLVELFSTVHLVDVDGESLARAVRRTPQPSDSVLLHAPVDIAAPLLSLTSNDLQPVAENSEHVAASLQALSAADADLGIRPRSCAAVVSLCLLTQLVGSLTEMISETHPLYASAVRAIRIGHLRRMLQLLRPGGIAVLVTDIVSSETVPELPDTPEAELGPLIRRLVNERNFFTGVNPAVVLSDLNMLERLPSGPEVAQVFDPWLWHMGPRVFAVYGVRCQTKRSHDADHTPIS